MKLEQDGHKSCGKIPTTSMFGISRLRIEYAAEILPYDIALRRMYWLIISLNLYTVPHVKDFDRLSWDGNQFRHCLMINRVQWNLRSGLNKVYLQPNPMIY